MRKVKDPKKRAAKLTAYQKAFAEYEDKMREYDEVLFPAYEQAYHRAYDQSAQRKRQREQTRQNHQAAAPAALIAAEEAERERQEREAAEREAAERAAAEQHSRQAAIEAAAQRPAYTNGLPTNRYCRCRWIDGPAPSEWDSQCLERLYNARELPEGHQAAYDLASYAVKRAELLQYHGHFVEAEVQYELALELRRPEHDRRLPDDVRDKVSQPYLERGLEACRRAATSWAGSAPKPVPVPTPVISELPPDPRSQMSLVPLSKRNPARYSSLEGKHWWKACVAWPDGDDRYR